MLICDKCKEKVIAAEQSENNRPFPAFTVVGGILGTFGAVLTGTILAVPAAIVAGAVADASTQRCDICDGEIEEDQSAYNLMEESGNGTGMPTYKSVGGSAGQPQANTQQPYVSPSPRGSQSSREMQEISQTFPSDIYEEPSDQQEECEYVFDELEGKLVQQNLTPYEDTVNINLADGFSGDVDVGFEAPEGFGVDDSPASEGFNNFSDFQDGVSIDIDPFEPTDEPTIGGF